MKLYIVRHGETQWNIQGLMQGWKDSPLTEKGISDAQRLGKHLGDIPFDFIICSPLGRAVETAKHIMGARSHLLLYNNAFREMGFGCWEGMPHEEVRVRYPVQQQHYWNAPHLYQPIDGESYDAFVSRVEEGLRDIVQNIKCNNILLVTHAAVIKAIFTIVYKRSLEHFWDPPFTYNTCLSILEIKDGEIAVLSEPDIPHLE